MPGRLRDNRLSWKLDYGAVKQGTNQADNDPLMDGAWALSFAGAQLNRKQDSWLSITVSGRTLLAFERPSGSSVPRLKWKGSSFVFWGFFAHHPALEADAVCRSTIIYFIFKLCFKSIFGNYTLISFCLHIRHVYFYQALHRFYWTNQIRKGCWWEFSLRSLTSTRCLTSPSAHPVHRSPRGIMEIWQSTMPLSSQQHDHPGGQLANVLWMTPTSSVESHLFLFLWIVAKSLFTVHLRPPGSKSFKGLGLCTFSASVLVNTVAGDKNVVDKTVLFFCCSKVVRLMHVVLAWGTRLNIQPLKGIRNILILFSLLNFFRREEKDKAKHLEVLRHKKSK